MYDRPEVALLDEAITSHRARRFGSVLVGPMARRHKHFGVVTFEPHDPAGPWLYLSTALARAGRRASFVVVAEREDRRHVETLTQLAWRHVEGSMPPLEAGSLVPIGRPWLPSSPLTWVLVSPPYPLGPQWPSLTLPDGGWDLLWAQPIAWREAQFARAHGVAALQERFRVEGIRMASGQRASVV